MSTITDWDNYLTLEGDGRELSLFFLAASKTSPRDYVNTKNVVACIQFMAKECVESLSFLDLKRLMKNKDEMKELKDLVEEINIGMVDMADESDQLIGIEDGIAHFDETGLSYAKYLKSLLLSHIKKNVMEVVEFVPHCDDPDCGLGTFQSTCLHCERPMIDYDLWWKKDSIIAAKEYDITCYRCGGSLFIKHDGLKTSLLRYQGKNPSLEI